MLMRYWGFGGCWGWKGIRGEWGDEMGEWGGVKDGGLLEMFSSGRTEELLPG